VAFYSPWLEPLLSSGRVAGGAETQILLLAKALAARGQRVCLVVQQADRPLPSSVDEVQIRAQPPPRGRNRLLRSLSGLVSLLRVLRPLEASVFVQRAAGTTTGMVGLIARLKRRRFVYSTASVIDFDYGRLERNRLKAWLFHLGVRSASEIVVQSHEQAALCRRRFGRSPAVIKSIAERADRRTGEPEALLWVGRAAHYKRPEAFLELARAVPEARFWMVAVPSNDAERQRADELERAAARLPNLELLIPRPRRELLELIDSAVAMVNTADYEGMPNIFLESWARGVPALALSHDPDELIEREGLGGFAGGSPERLAALAREMWRARDDQVEVAARCRAYLAREHGVDALATKWIAALGLGEPVGVSATGA
jgi:glycosyltransferase involved in cell wall biosynthesis